KTARARSAPSRRLRAWRVDCQCLRLDANRHWKVGDVLAVRVHRKRPTCGDLDTARAKSADLVPSDVAAGKNSREIHEKAKPAYLADRDHIELTVVHARIGRDVHAAAKRWPVRDGD